MSRDRENTRLRLCPQRPIDAPARTARVPPHYTARITRRPTVRAYPPQLQLHRRSSRFDEDDSFLEVWHEAREAAASPSSSSSSSGATAGSTEERPLARHLGVGGDGPVVARRLSLLLEEEGEEEESRAQTQSRRRRDGDSDRVRGGGASWDDLSGAAAVAAAAAAAAVPSMFFGDLRAGDGATTAETMELCRDAGVQAFSWRYDGGLGGEEAGKGAAAADYEHENVRTKK